LAKEPPRTGGKVFVILLLQLIAQLAAGRGAPGAEASPGPDPEAERRRAGSQPTLSYHTPLLRSDIKQ